MTEVEPEAMPGELSDDLNSLMFSVNGIVYTLPVPFAELEENGWGPRDLDSHVHATYKLDPSHSFVGLFVLENQTLSVTFTNFTEEVLPLTESYLSGVAVRPQPGHEDEAQLILPGNIMLGSTYDDVITTHGEPSGREQLDDMKELIYFTEYAVIQIFIAKETDLVVMMSMMMSVLFDM